MARQADARTARRQARDRQGTARGEGGCRRTPAVGPRRNPRAPREWGHGAQDGGRRAAGGQVSTMPTAQAFDAEGKGTGSVELPADVFGITPHAAVMHEALLAHLANRRLGTRATKTRGEVAGSTRKIWRQKGTGRARHGSRKAPLFIGAGSRSVPNHAIIARGRRKRCGTWPSGRRSQPRRRLGRSWSLRRRCWKRRGQR